MLAVFFVRGERGITATSQLMGTAGSERGLKFQSPLVVMERRPCCIPAIFWLEAAIAVSSWRVGETDA